MRKIFNTGLVLIGLTLFSLSLKASAQAEPDSFAVSSASAKLDSLMRSLDYKSGQVTVKDDLFTINIPDDFKFLTAKDAQFILKDIWGNPNVDDVLGMLMPKNANVRESGGWAVVYTYSESGHVKDDDAEKINYDDLLEEMKKQTITASAERTKMGYTAIELVGWAKKPYYDKDSHKLHWAKEIKFGNSNENTLNYNIRMLGRKGVLVMNIVSQMSSMPLVESNVNKILASTNFTKGNEYNDFDSNVDKVAEYGIGGLIAGGILLKTGLLAKIGILLLKFWKLIALSIAGVFASIRKKLFGKKEKNQPPPPADIPPADATSADAGINS